MYAWAKGYFILKRDKMKGFDVYFETNLRVRVQMCPEQSLSAKSEQASRPRKVWATDIWGFEAPLPEREHYFHECFHYTKWEGVIPLVPLETPCRLHEAKAKSNIKDSLHSHQEDTVGA